MTTLESQLLAVLQSIRGNGSFVVSGKSRFVLPGLHIGSLGEMGFPLNPLQLKALIGLAKKAPFGKGSETITDTTVRSAWEIDASQLDFRNPQWELTMRKMVKKVQLGLGIEEKMIGHSLYKMLIYEEGDFFLPHKDSEKEKGMFGTLIVGLPAAHTGGTLMVRFDEREEIVDFSGPASNYELPYVAFYADCEHEIKPITSGYRVCLVYNLIQGEGASGTSSPRFSGQVTAMAALLDTWAESETHFPKAILLGHEYTPANFSHAALKHHDRPRAEALFAAAERAGYFARPGLVTHYQMGELESGRDYNYGRRYGRNSYEEDNKAEETMGEIYETYTTIEHWAAEDETNLGHLSISQEDLLTEIHIGEGEPTEQEAEDYTGNAGMTMEYWYHYGAVVLWPRKQHIELVLAKTNAVRLAWLGFYLKHWEKYDVEAQEYVRQLILVLGEPDAAKVRHDDSDFNVLARGLAKLEDETFLQAHGIPVLTAFFDRIAAGSWLELFQVYDPESLEPVFQAACSSGKALAIYRLTGMLELLSAASNPALQAFLLGQIDRIPDYLSHVNLDKIKEVSDWDSVDIKQKSASLFIVNQLLTLSRLKQEDDAWIGSTLAQLTRSLPRNYVNGVLATALMSHSDQTGALYRRLYAVCAQHIAQSTAIRPTPLPDWTRAVPHSKSYKEVWEMLAPFLASPTEQVFEYRKAQQYRSEVESAIRNATIDLRTETITRGSPHTLRIIKTQAEYERALKIWEEDVALLAELERIRH